MATTFCVNPTEAPATKRSSECPNAKTSTSRYASTLPKLEASDIIATSGADAQGVLTSPKIMPTKNTPKNLRFRSFENIAFLFISPKTPKEYNPKARAKTAAKMYAQNGAIEKKSPSFATRYAKIEKLIITPKAKIDEKIRVNLALFFSSISLESPTALPTKRGTLKSEQGARLVNAPAPNAPKKSQKKLVEFSSSMK